MLHSTAQLSPDVSSDEGNLAGNTAKKMTPKGKWRPPDRECVVYMYNGSCMHTIYFTHVLYNHTCTCIVVSLVVGPPDTSTTITRQDSLLQGNSLLTLLMYMYCTCTSLISPLDIIIILVHNVFLMIAHNN